MGVYPPNWGGVEDTRCSALSGILTLHCRRYCRIPGAPERPYTCFTSYPVDLLVLHEGAPEPGLRPLVVFSRKHRNSEAEARKRLKKQLVDYGLDIAPGVTVYADPSTHSPGLCGHMINDPRSTGVEANCVE